MPPPADVTLGPLTRLLVYRSKWGADSVFPSSQHWADETERVLCSLDVQGVLKQFLPRLCGRETERDGALAEARMGFFFRRVGFRILRWEPEEVLHRPGDLDIQWKDSEPIFVEVKGPGWEGELSPEERAAGRQRAPKYVGEARAIDPVERVQYAMNKALPKFSPARINLIVVADDLFLSPADIPTEILTGRLTKTLAEPAFRVAAGVLLMNAVSFTGEPAVEYRTYFIPNPDADRGLPDPVRIGFLADNANPHGPRRARQQ